MRSSWGWLALSLALFFSFPEHSSARGNPSCAHLSRPHDGSTVPTVTVLNPSIRETRGTLLVVDAVSSGNILPPYAQTQGFKVVHVHSKGIPLSEFKKSFLGTGIDIDIQHRGDLAATLAEIKRHGPILAVLPVSEAGVEFAGTLYDSLHTEDASVRGNTFHPWFRSKGLLAERLKDRKLGKWAAPQVEASEWTAAKKWLTSAIRFPQKESQEPLFVLKPANSSSTEDVFFCTSLEEGERLFNYIRHKKNKYGRPNETVIVQKYLKGPEYVVNLVRAVDPATGAVVTKVTDLWLYEKRPRKGGANLYDYDTLLEAYGTVQNQLVDLVTESCDALDLKTGWVHAEVIMTPEGPKLIDLGARPMGAGQPRIVKQATGQSQIDVGLLAFTDFQAFKALPDRYTRNAHACVLSLANETRGARFNATPLTEIQGMNSFFHYKPCYEHGQFMVETTSLGKIIAQIELVNTDEAQLARDRERVREIAIENHGFELPPIQRH